MRATSKSETQLGEELTSLRKQVSNLEAQVDRQDEIYNELRQREHQFRTLYEETPAMYFTVDPAGTVLSVNPYGAQQLGYTVEELTNQPVLDVFYEEDRPEVQKQLKICVDHPEKAFDWEFRKIRKDGSIMWVREIARSLRDDGGKTVVLIVCEDITGRKATEAELRSSREQYKSLYTKTPVMLQSIDENHRLVDVSEYWLETMGYSREEVIGREVTLFLTEESKTFARETVLPKFYREGIVRDVPYSVVKKGGEIMEVLLSSIAEHDETGKFVRSLAVMIDMTQKNQAEETLRKANNEMEQKVIERTAEIEHQRKYLRQVIDVDPNFIFAKDREGRFMLANKAVSDLYGVSPEEIIGKTDAELNPVQDEVAHFEKIDKEVFDTLEERFIPEEAVTDKNGKQRWVQTVKRPILDDSGNPIQVLGSATDITVRREIEKKLRASEAQLKDRQEELRVLAGRLLTAQEDERRRLAREMHDDMSQRLAGVSMQAGRLQQMLGKTPEDVSGVLDLIQDSLADLATDVHEISRRLHPSILEDLGLAEAIAAECSGFSKREDIEVSFDAKGVPDRISIDVALCLYRITQEALRNASKHGQTKTASVTLKHDSRGLQLAIEDKGIGFDSDKQPRGEGLGLGSMRERIRLIQADLSVDSKPGKGTVIRVWVPERVLFKEQA